MDVLKSGSLDKLAKLLAAEDITIQHRKVETAYFDVKNRLLVLPIWEQMSETLYHMLVLHEVGHALDTPPEGWLSAIKNMETKRGKSIARIFQSYLNIIEDARIERRIKNKFQGSRRDFVEGYDQLHERDFFGIKSRDIDTLPLVDRINLHFKLGTRIKLNFSEKESEFISKADSTTTWDDVVRLAEELLEYSSANPSNEGTDIEFDFDEDYDGSGGGADYGFDPADGEDGSDEGEGDGEGAGDEDRDDSESNVNGNKPGRFSPEASITEDQLKRNMEQLNSKYKHDPVYAVIPKNIDSSKFIIPYKEVLERFYGNSRSAYAAEKAFYLKEFRSNNKTAIDYMVKEFELKKAAFAYSRSKQAKTGVIDVNKLHSYKMSEDIFRRLTVTPDGKNHGLVIYLDMSGSMSGDTWAGTIDQLNNLATFCRRVNIPHRFYGFITTWHLDDSSQKKRRAYIKSLARRNTNCLVPRENEFSLIELFHENMSLKEYNEMIFALMVSADNNSKQANTTLRKFTEEDVLDTYSWRNCCFYHFDKLNLRCFSLGGTPMNDALLLARDIILKFVKEKRIDVVNFVCLTDGQSDGLPYAYIDDINDCIRRSHIDRDTIIQDEETKLNETKQNGRVRNEVWQTEVFTKFIKKSLNVNAIGFYILSSTYSLSNFFSMCNVGWEEQEKIRSSYKKNKFATLPNALMFDEFHCILGGNALKVEGDLTLDDNLTKSQIKKAFVTNQKKRGTSRVILKRFIEKIS